MEKVVLSNGYEFELVTNGVIKGAKDDLTVSFKSESETAEELLNIWSGNSTITVQIGEDSVQQYTGYTLVSSVTITPNYETSQTETARVATVKVTVADLTSRVDDIEETVADIVDTMLG